MVNEVDVTKMGVGTMASVRDTSAPCATTVVVTEGMLLAGFGSTSSADTETLPVTTPVAGPSWASTATTSVCPLAMAAPCGTQVTVWEFGTWLQLPFPLPGMKTAERRLAPSGRSSA